MTQEQEIIELQIQVTNLKAKLARVRAGRHEAQLAELEQEIARLRDWQATVTAALGREGGSFYGDVPKHVRELRAEVDRLRRERDALREAAFKAGWASGYYDGGEHDCRMFTPTAERGWDDYKREERRQAERDAPPREGKE